MASSETLPARRKQNPWIKFLLEMGPLLLFFFANARPKLFEPLVKPILPESILAGPSAGLFTATIVLMVAVVAALIASFLTTKRLPIMPLVTAILVLVFGALTLYLQDDRFIKMKPTVLYLAFGLALFGGLLFGKPLLPIRPRQCDEPHRTRLAPVDHPLGGLLSRARGLERDCLAYPKQ